AIWDHSVCTLTCTFSYTMSKTADRLILRPEQQDSPISFSTGGTPPRKISKVVAYRGTECESGRARRLLRGLCRSIASRAFGSCQWFVRSCLWRWPCRAGQPRPRRSSCLASQSPGSPSVERARDCYLLAPLESQR